jgi:hypothetical protein
MDQMPPTKKLSDNHRLMLRFLQDPWHIRPGIPQVANYLEPSVVGNIYRFSTTMCSSFSDWRTEEVLSVYKDLVALGLIKDRWNVTSLSPHTTKQTTELGDATLRSI